MINQFNSATLLCLSQAVTRISNVIYHGHCYVEVRDDCSFFLSFFLFLFFLINGIVDHHSLSFTFIINLSKRLNFFSQLGTSGSNEMMR